MEHSDKEETLWSREEALVCIALHRVLGTLTSRGHRHQVQSMDNLVQRSVKTSGVERFL